MRDLHKTGRISWRDGQVLASRDLKAELQNEERYRKLHNRYLHGAWGIAFGLQVNLSPDGSRVIVSPGYAIDKRGRDLLLAEIFMVVAPPVDGRFVLAASHDESTACPPSLPDADFCPGVDTRRERAAIAWMEEDEIDFGIHVPLARASFASSKVQGDLDSRVRHYARRMAGPHIGWGATHAGNSNWQDISAPKRPDLWLQADVDTSSAGFVNTPRYLATLCRLSAARKRPRQGSLDEFAARFGTGPALTLDGIGSVIRATATQFTYRLPRGALPFGIDLTASEAEAGGWAIAWIGIESPDATLAQPDLATIVTLLGAAL
jgi:hypothetical protein